MLATNTQRRSLRRGTTPSPEPVVLDVVAGPEHAYSSHDWVSRALATLSPRERDVVACTEGVGLDVESTARALDMTAVAVRVARHRGLRRLQRLHAAEQPGLVYPQLR